MEKIKLGLFDIFAFIFPGLLISFAVSLPVFVEPGRFTDMLNFIDHAKEVPFTLLVLFISYIVGASIHQVGYYWYYLVTFILGYRFLKVTLTIMSILNKDLAAKIKKA